MTDLAERKLRVLEEENEILKSQMKKLKGKFKEYKVEA